MGKKHHKKNTALLKHPAIIIMNSGASRTSSLDRATDTTIATEILSRLPVKSLMRFKCVSKRWLSLIEDDPYLIDLHLTRSNKARPGLFAAVPSKNQYVEEGDELFLLTAHLLFHEDCSNGTRPAVVNTSSRRKTNSFFYNEILGPVNGLICFFDWSACAVQIYNVSTREVTPWIESSVFTKAVKKSQADSDSPYYALPECQLGFDPVTKEHKVVFVWDFVEEQNYNVNNFFEGKIRKFFGKMKKIRHKACEVLTVGDNTWRIIDEFPTFPVKRCPFNVYANGSIYWYGRDYMVLSDDDNPTEEVSTPTEFLVVFDIGSEKFRRIPIPISAGFTDVHFSRITLLEVDGGVALLRTEGKYPCSTKMWIFYDYDKKANGKSNNSKKQLWSNEMTLTFPIDLDWHQPIYFRSISGTHQIIIETDIEPKRRGGGGDGGVKVQKRHRTFALPWIYSYNWKKNTMTEVDMDGVSSSVHVEVRESNYVIWRTFVESLLPVRKKLQRHHHDGGTDHPPQAADQANNKLTFILVFLLITFILVFLYVFNS